MRRAACLLLLLLGAVWCLTRVEVAIPRPTQAALSSPWRRTRDGWQRSDRWAGALDLAADADAIAKAPNTSPTRTLAPPNPLLWAALEALAAAFVLVALSPTAPEFRDCSPDATGEMEGAGESSPI